MIKRYIRNYIIRNLITSSLFFLGDNLQYSAKTSSKDTLDNYRNYNLENINKETFNTLDELTKCDSSFYSEKTKTSMYQIEPSLSFEYDGKI